MLAAICSQRRSGRLNRLAVSRPEPCGILHLQRHAGIPRKTLFVTEQEIPVECGERTPRVTGGFGRIEAALRTRIAHPLNVFS